MTLPKASPGLNCSYTAIADGAEQAAEAHWIMLSPCIACMYTKTHSERKIVGLSLWNPAALTASSNSREIRMSVQTCRQCLVRSSLMPDKQISGDMSSSASRTSSIGHSDL